MNSNFDDEQIAAYASAFEEGDAIWCDGEWRKVSKSEKTLGLTCESPNRYVIRCFDGEVAISGFKEEETPYRVTTLEDYELKGDEKFVWLGPTDRYRTFGKVYTACNYFDAWGKWFIAYPRDNDWELVKPKLGNPWGVIPSFDQVKNAGKEDGKMGEIETVEESKCTGKFKVGDEVKVIGFVNGADNVRIKRGINEVGIVDRVDSDMTRFNYVVRFNDGLHPFNEAELELVSIKEDRPASSHYHIDNNGNDVWQFADDNLSEERVKGFHQINAIKYVSRYNKKHDTKEKRIEDLEKAKVSIKKLIELEQEE